MQEVQGGGDPESLNSSKPGAKFGHLNGDN